MQYNDYNFYILFFTNVIFFKFSKDITNVYCEKSWALNIDRFCSIALRDRGPVASDIHFFSDLLGWTNKIVYYFVAIKHFRSLKTRSFNLSAKSLIDTRKIARRRTLNRTLDTDIEYGLCTTLRQQVALAQDEMNDILQPWIS